MRPLGPLPIVSLTVVIALWMASLSAAAEHGLYFGGQGGSINLTDVKLPADATQLTVECRFKTSVKLRQTVKLIAQWTDDARADDKGTFHLDLKPPSQIAFSLRNAKGQVKSIVGRAPWSDGKWHHVAATYDGQQLTIVLDGKTIGATKLVGFGTPAPSSLPLQIGPTVPAKGRRPTPFEGFISDAAIWSTARNAESIAANLTEPLTGSEPGLVALVVLREDSPTSKVKSKVGSGNEATLPKSLAATGWCITPMWHEPMPDRPFLHLFKFNLSTKASKPDSSQLESATNSIPGISGAIRQIIVSNEKTKQVGVLWQDKASDKVFITWVAPDLTSHETIALKGMDSALLAAGTTDTKGNLAYLMIEKGARGRPETQTLKANLYVASPDGKARGDKPVDMSKSKTGFNVYNYGGRWVGSMRFHNGVLGLILPRTMHRSADGLNHQGAIAVALSAKDLTVIKNMGQTSGHSFGNILKVSSRGEFIGLDLGDNYPRGVHLHKFTRAGRVSRVLFTYKTRHGTTTRNSPEVYKEISGGGKTFYKWSNDNATYTELGGVIEGRKSYSVIFSTDRSLEGKVLDNSRAFRNSGDPRDIAMLRVIKNFEKVKSTNNVVSDAIMADIPRGAKTETGGFYNFGGGFDKQRITGVIWLTKYAKDEAAHAPHPIRLNDGSILIIWEKTGPEGASLWAMKVAETGKILTEPMNLGVEMRLNREAPSITVGGRAFVLAKDKAGHTKLLFVYDQ
jgi:hypothetical protein